MSARRVTYVTLILMLAVSMSANIGHTLLAESVIPAWLRMIGAVLWPLIVFLAIEVLIRTDWARGVSHLIIRAMILGPAIPAAITSYEHMHAVLLAMGERPFIAKIGPGAVDLLMIGCTLALLLVRQASASPLSVEDALQKWMTVEEIPVSPAPAMTEEILPAPVMEEELPAPLPAEEVIRSAPRRSSWDAREVAELILRGVKTDEIAEKTGAGPATIGRFRKVIRMLQAEPRMTVDPTKEKVTSDNIRMIRELVAR